MIQLLFGSSLASGLIVIFNLIIIESLLSVDNAAVLAGMVRDLQGSQKTKALRYGILGAYVLRGLCLIFASYLIKVLWLKIIGGIYFCYLSYDFFTKKPDTSDQGLEREEKSGIWDRFKATLGIFWSTVILIELMDLSFSIDNIFAAVAFSDKIGLICTGVFIGILAMRFIAQGFIKLIEKYPFLEKITFIVIAILGIKLILSGVCDYIPGNVISPVLNSHFMDYGFSIGITAMFLLPIIFKRK